MALEYPHIFQDGVGEVASGAAVDDNFNAAKAAIDASLARIEALENAKPPSLPSTAVYGALVARSNNVEYEPSGTRAVFVTLFIGALVETDLTYQLFVGGVQIGAGTAAPELPPKAFGGVAQTVGFLCPAGKKWKVVGNEFSLQSSYLVL